MRISPGRRPKGIFPKYGHRSPAIIKKMPIMIRLFCIRISYSKEGLKNYGFEKLNLPYTN
jgi:hypothetical protein